MANSSYMWVAPSGRSMPGGYDQWEVADVNAAVELASQFRASGRYKVFRGQRDASWPVSSSFARMSDDGRGAAQQEMSAFYNWAQSAPELVPYLQDENAIIAAAQHHGVCATTFIDFTRDPTVAGWFATDGARIGDYGAIYMIDPDEVESVFAAFSGSGPTLRFLEVDVHNLWRLQAQSGLFLEAQTSVESVWPLDRIVFPHTDAILNVERRRIYPDRRSNLEQMIESYQLWHSTSESSRKFFRDNPGIMYISIDKPPDLTSGLPRSGLPEALNIGPREAWSDMDIDTLPPEVLFSEITQDAEMLRALIHKRRSSTDLIQVVASPQLQNGSFQTLLNNLWEGMRPHPYDERELASAIMSLSRFYPILGDFPLNEGRGPDRVADKLLSSPIEIEMGIIGGGYTRACVSTLGLWSAMTTDGRAFAGLGGEPSASSIAAALDRFGGRTVGLFDSAALLSLFATEIVPWQVAVKRPLIAFWPSHIESLGRP